MRKNVSGQKIGAQMVTAADGTAFTGAVTVYVTGDAGTQAVGSVGSGSCTHEGNGYHTYAPSQAETNYDLIAFTFIGTGAVPSTVQIYTMHDSNVTSMASDTLTAAALATDAVTEIQSGLSTLTQANVRSAVGLASANLDTQLAAIPTALANADAVWDEAYSGHTTAGTFGKLLDTLRKANYTVDGTVVAGGTLSTTTFRTNVVANTSAYAHSVLLFVTGPLAGENSPILSYTSTNGVIVLEEALTAIPSPGDEFIIAAAQHVHAIQDIADAIELTVLPLDATVVDRVAGTTINLFTNETPVVVVAVVDADGNNVDLTSLSLEIIIELRPSSDIVVVADGSITHSDGSFAFTVPSAVTDAARACKWALRKTTDSSVLVQGDLFVNYAPTNDP